MAMDIEDLGLVSSLSPNDTADDYYANDSVEQKHQNHDEYDTRHQVSINHKPTPKSSSNQSESQDTQNLSSNNVIPGVENVYLETFGCAHNVSDGEYMKGLLSNYGYTLVDINDKQNADVWIINSCTVKDPSQAAFLNLVNAAKKNKRCRGVVVTGCVPQADRNLPLEGVSMVGVSQIASIVSVVEETLKGNVVKLLGKPKGDANRLPALDLPKIRKNKLVEIIPISTGCLGNCTYCKTKFARGNLGSYPLETLANRLRNVLSPENVEVDGSQVKQVWLASEDTGAYGLDIGSNIGELLRVLSGVMAEHGDERKMLKVGMTNPPYMLKYLDVIAEVLNHKHVFKYLHIPVQSGSNRVLAFNAMKREYTVEQFCRVADYMKKYVPNITIATDIICGFPGETDDDFQQTIALVKKYKFPILNISKFYARPGTAAAKMHADSKLKVSSDIAKKRSTELTRLFESYRSYDYLVGSIVDVWFGEEIHEVKSTKNCCKDKTENGEKDAFCGIEEKDEGCGCDENVPNGDHGECQCETKITESNMLQCVGHTREYIKVVVPFDQSLIGEKRSVKISSAHKFHVAGEIFP